VIGANRPALELSTHEGSYPHRFYGDRDEVAPPHPYQCMAHHAQTIGECPRLSNRDPRSTVIVVGALRSGILPIHLVDQRLAGRARGPPLVNCDSLV